MPTFSIFIVCFTKTTLSLVRLTGLEPARRETLDPKSNASTNSATGAILIATFRVCGCKGTKKSEK